MLLKSVVYRETFLLRSACTHMFVCVYVLIDRLLYPCPLTLVKLKSLLC